MAAVLNVNIRRSLVRFAPGDSLAHRLDPRAKIFVVLAAMVAAFLAHDRFAFVALFAFVAAATAASCMAVRGLLRAVRTLALLMALSFTLNLLWTPGEPLWDLGLLTVTREGLQAAFLLAARLAIMGLLSTLLGYTTSSLALSDALERLLSPFGRLKLGVRGIALTLSLALRFVPIVMEEIDTIIKAQRARGIDPAAGDLLHRAQRAVYLLVPLLRNTLQRAEDLALAMEARGYDPRAPRSRLRPMRFSLRDWAVVGIGLLLVILTALP